MDEVEQNTALPLAPVLQCLAAVLQRLQPVPSVASETTAALCVGLEPHRPWVVRLEAAKASGVLLQRVAALSGCVVNAVVVVNRVVMSTCRQCARYLAHRDTSNCAVQTAEALVPPLCGCLQEVKVSALRTAALDALGASVGVARDGALGEVQRALEELVARELNTVVKAEATRLLGVVRASR